VSRGFSPDSRDSIVYSCGQIFAGCRLLSFGHSQQRRAAQVGGTGAACPNPLPENRGTLRTVNVAQRGSDQERPITTQVPHSGKQRTAVDMRDDRRQHGGLTRSAGRGRTSRQPNVRIVISPPITNEIALFIDQCPSAELPTLMDQLVDQAPDNAFLAWALPHLAHVRSRTGPAASDRHRPVTGTSPRSGSY
jgi:hypothetical protein